MNRNTERSYCSLQRIDYRMISAPSSEELSVSECVAAKSIMVERSQRNVLLCFFSPRHQSDVLGLQSHYTAHWVGMKLQIRFQWNGHAVAATSQSWPCVEGMHLSGSITALQHSDAMQLSLALRVWDSPGLCDNWEKINPGFEALVRLYSLCMAQDCPLKEDWRTAVEWDQSAAEMCQCCVSRRIRMVLYLNC